LNTKALRAAMPVWARASRAAYSGSSSLLRTVFAACRAPSMLLTRVTEKTDTMSVMDRMRANATYNWVASPTRCRKFMAVPMNCDTDKALRLQCIHICRMKISGGQFKLLKMASLLY